ncbi:hypothetical protein [Bacillus mycoides]|uniref:Uncharacterized protein n=1 Tax=Bacillus mycoides TaxID=1405 RepID=A0ABC9QVB8_BACMY|nr:hypothetical protein [Bacillus mycoides]EJR30016.1 hypothetical protein III_05785 [Bacillus mycoides]
MLQETLYSIGDRIEEYVRMKGDKYAIVEFEKDDEYIVVIESDRVTNYYIEIYNYLNMNIPIISFQTGLYKTFYDSGIVHCSMASPQLQSLAAVVDLHLGTEHIFD